MVKLKDVVSLLQLSDSKPQYSVPLSITFRFHANHF